MSHEFESGIGNRKGAWHGLMDVWEPAYEGDFLDWLTALELSGTNWPVVKEPVYRKGEETGRFWVVRTTDDKVLADHTVGKQYELIQNVEGFQYLSQLTDDSNLEIETAMSLYGGKMVTILARKPSQIEIAKGLNELFDTYIGFTNRHDGMGACKIFTCRERIVCANTQAVAEGEFKKSGRHWSIRHQGDTELKLSEAREALQLSFEEDTAFEAAMTDMLNSPLSQSSYSKNVKTIVGLDDIDRAKQPKKFNNAKKIALTIDEIRRQEDNLQNVSETDYGLFQAVTQYETHNKKYRNESTKFQNLAVEGGELTNRAFAVLSA
jgi:phage/plasmid-like protein (TIGR03299 family)